MVLMTFKYICFIVPLLFFLSGITSAQERKRILTYRYVEQNNFPCPASDFELCYNGYAVNCCSNEDCPEGQVCCHNNEGCTIRCISAVLNGAAPAFEMTRANCDFLTMS
ncbi:hypothetical protein NPIL_78321 [Nephila pilipes]|uniref:Spider venom protein n=1 Tax=Nephila pilipes TaxID=299642 RepID=A0A8X6Q2X6_NEPPI|nr:hypothetical protein NPIL_78321 [Nephila pilipes]